MSKEKATLFRWSKVRLLFVSSVSIAWVHAMLIHDQITYSDLEELYYFPLLLGSLMFGGLTFSRRYGKTFRVYVPIMSSLILSTDYLGYLR